MQIIRALDNDSIDPSALDGIKEDVDYYAEVNNFVATKSGFTPSL
jgi:CCR4-NOT transcriptional regulation complex NOT5 subunit